MKKFTIFFSLLILLSTHSFGMSIEQNIFGVYPKNKKPVYLFTLKNDVGMTVKITNYRAAITSIIIPNKDNKPTDVVLGYNTFDQYWHDSETFFGAIVGRYANRISNANMVLHKQSYSLPIHNSGDFTLHSGQDGFNKALWEPSVLEMEDGIVLTLKYTSPDGEQGFPGNLNTIVSYKLDKDTYTLEINYTATTDQDTYINLTNHVYFNLTGEGTGVINNQEILINADYFTPTNKKQLPTGEIKSVENTPFDLRKRTPMGENIDSTHPQMIIGKGYDHNFILRKEYPGDLSLAAQIFSPDSGIMLTLSTTEPGMQFYTGNFLNKNIIGKNGHVYSERTGFALETQHYPDSLHFNHFPSTLLKAGETYTQKTIYSFS